MTQPKRIQRQRTAGWRMPVEAVYVGRPSLYGNPWVGPDCVRAYRRFLSDVLCGVLDVQGCDGELDCELVYRKPIDRWQTLRASLLPRAEFPVVLCCWCPLDKPCHADALLQVITWRGPRRCRVCGDNEKAIFSRRPHLAAWREWDLCSDCDGPERRVQSPETRVKSQR